jgi:uncharacterized protein YndB with AHSA1/START domain
MNSAVRNDESKAIVVEYDLPHAPAKVWRALTDPDLLGRWLMTNDIRPIVGHKFKFTATPMHGWDGICHCEVLEVEEPRRLRYSWSGGGATARLDTVVTWTLSPTASGGTLLHLEHAGFKPANDPAFEIMSKGWSGHLRDRIAAVLAQSA